MLHGAMVHGHQHKIRFSQKPEVLDIEICRLPKDTRIYPSDPYMPCGHACILLSGFEVARTAANSALPSVWCRRPRSLYSLPYSHPQSFHSKGSCSGSWKRTRSTSSRERETGARGEGGPLLLPTSSPSSVRSPCLPLPLPSPPPRRAPLICTQIRNTYYAPQRSAAVAPE